MLVATEQGDWGNLPGSQLMKSPRAHLPPHHSGQWQIDSHGLPHGLPPRLGLASNLAFAHLLDANVEEASALGDDAKQEREKEDDSPQVHCGHYSRTTVHFGKASGFALAFSLAQARVAPAMTFRYQRSLSQTKKPTSERSCKSRRHTAMCSLI
jgi:hypothetical protein